MASADRLIEVFNEAKARPAGAERDQFLSEACRDEPALKEQVLALLQAHEGAGDFLKNTQAIPSVTVLTEKPGDKIGRYKLLQQIGEGGCGVVYMAEQEEPVRRRVAFKIIKLGMDTKQVVARFEAEGQALALMDHPSIAKVFDAGATNIGRPYFVMELVRGIKITDYCDQNNLPTEARLKLFTQVCHAIQHAHQKGIIHRDIKPSNILVTVNDGVPVPKVIDFGIAKAIEQRLTDKTVFTAFEHFIGTPAYMSPEQAEMTSLDIDTRADIYSLGVLLYELLSGNTPFDAQTLLASGVAEIRRIIREQEPLKPSTRLNTLNDADLSTVAQRRHTDPPKLLHLIRGDLDWIVMKCLEKDRTRRYETANGLAVDIQRHLSNEPVVARPPSNLYRFQKLVRRNKLAFVAASAVIAALVLGLGISTWMFFKEKQARQRAIAAERAQIRLRELAEIEKNKSQTEAAKTRQVARFLEDMLEGVGPSVALGRDTTLMREILDKTAERLGGELTNQPAVEAELRNTLGQIYSQIGEFEKAEDMFRRALTIRTNLGGTELPGVATTLANLAWLLRHQRQSEAAAMAREALAIRQKLFGPESMATALSFDTLGMVLEGPTQHLAEAEACFRESLAIFRKLKDDRGMAGALDNLGVIFRDQGKFPEAESTFREALVAYKKGFGEEHPQITAGLWNIAFILHAQAKLPQAEEAAHECVTILQKFYGEESERTGWGLALLANVLADERKVTEAEMVLRQAVANLHKVWSTDQDSWHYTLTALGIVLDALMRDGQHQAAEQLASDVVSEAAGVLRTALASDRSCWMKEPSQRWRLDMLLSSLNKVGKRSEAEALSNAILTDIETSQRVSEDSTKTKQQKK